MSPRTLWNWRHREEGRVGRPPRSPEERRRAFRAVARAWCGVGHGAGWRTVHVALGDAVPVRLVQESLREAKRLHRRHVRRRRAARRVHVEVLATNVLWHEDATHLGRVATAEVQGDVIRDAAVPDVLVASVGGAVRAQDAVANLEAALSAAGEAPLVHATDNGPAYRAEDYEAWLARHRVVHLKNLPHTPEHNARAERTLRDVKEDAELGRGVDLGSVAQAERRVARACAHLERRAALAVTRPPPSVRYNAEQRERFYEAVCRRVAAAVQGAGDARAARMAEREAILAEMEERGLIRRTRGGVPFPLPKSESVL